MKTKISQILMTSWVTAHSIHIFRQTEIWIFACPHWIPFFFLSVSDRILKEELHRSVGAQYATGDQWRNSYRKNEGMEPKQKQYQVVGVTGDRSKVQCYKEQHCIGTWNVRSMNPSKLEVVKQEMARVNVDILGISELQIHADVWKNQYNIVK